MDNQHPIEKVMYDVRDLKTYFLRMETDSSERLSRLEEEVRRLTVREEEYLVERQLRISFRTKEEQLRTKEEQLRTKEEELRTKEEQLQQQRQGGEASSLQRQNLATTRKIPKSDGVDDRLDALRRTSLHQAALEGDLEAVNRLLWWKGADANLRDNEGCTPLHFAAMKGHPVVCASLVAAEGADINAMDNNGWTPLHWASRHGKAEVVRLLLERGADTSLRNHKGRTPLYLATEEGHSVVCASLVAAEDTDINTKDRFGWSPLHWASRHGKAEVVRLLLERGADATLRDNKGHSPLHLAALYGHAVLCASLVAVEGVDINAKNKTGWTPLHWASRNSKKEVVRFLLERGADPTLRNNEGFTYLEVTTEASFGRHLRDIRSSEQT